ncbi:MAG TPA: EpsD family peptidyl-prolyl cis-trans isomerase [Thiobacillus sp.]
MALSVVLSACEQPATTAQGSIVAKVGNETVSEAELGSAVARLGPMNAAESARARSKVLEALIDQYLVSNAAKSAKLDTSPDVALAMAQAQRQVLVEAYMARLFKNLAAPANTEINDYYVRHPELFAQRKLYRLQELELELQLAPARVAEVEARLKLSRSLAEFGDWLRAQGIDGKLVVAARPAEQIPAPLLAQLVNMKAGQTLVQATGENRISVLQLQDSRTQPVTLEQAKDAIERVLLGEKRKVLLEAEVRKLRAGSKVEYASGFAPAAPTRTP